jgi:heme exporter protein D
MGHLPTGLQLVAAVGWAFGESVGTLFIVQSVRRLGLIIKAQGGSVAIDLFRQQSLYAFSTVTMSTALGILAIGIYAPLVSGQLLSPLYLWSSVAMAVLALAIAVFPLQRTHSRLVEEKRRLGLANGARMGRVLADLQEAVDRMEMAAIDAGQKALGALIAERDLVAKAATWPWAPGTFRTLATTVVMPVVLLLGGRLLDAWLRGG